MAKSKTILITGAGSGIGKDTAFALAQRGHIVIATTHTEGQALALKDEAALRKVSLTILTLDITVEHERGLLSTFDLDVFIACAAVGETGPLAEVPLERMRRNFETNVFSTFATIQRVLPSMMQRKMGSVIVVSSVAGRIPIAFLNPYSMTKFALSGGVAALREEVHAIEPAVHVCLVEPGAYATGFNQRMFATKYEWLTGRSAYNKHIDTMRKNELRFSRIEQKSTKSIVNVIIRATEAVRPKLRYGAPTYQMVGVYILRLLGR